MKARRQRRLGGLRCGWLALVLVALAQPVRADFRQSYLDGVAALRRGEPARAVELLRQAIAERPRDQARARLVGAIPEPYLPHAYLGLAYAQLGKCSLAGEEWRLSARQGAVAVGSALAEEIAAARLHCEAPPAAPSPPAGQGPPHGEKAGEIAAPAAGGPPVVLPVLQLETEVSELAPRPATTPPAGGEGAGVPAAVTAETPAAGGGPPVPLLRAIQAYFNGDYQRALDLLAGPDPRPPSRELFFRRLVRAAARHALYLLDGERDADLLAAATADLVAARRERPSYAPHPDQFSPRFVAFFRDHPP